MDTLCVEDLRVAPLWELSVEALRMSGLGIDTLRSGKTDFSVGAWGLSVEALGVNILRGRLSRIYVALLVNRLYCSPLLIIYLGWWH